MSTKKVKTSKAEKLLESISGEPLTLNSLILAIRQGEEMTQSQFAKKLGVSRQYLCDLEHNRRFASPKAAEEFAIILGYSSLQFVKLCLQDLIEREGMSFLIEVKAA